MEDARKALAEVIADTVTVLDKYIIEANKIGLDVKISNTSTALSSKKEEKALEFSVTRKINYLG